MKPEAIVKHGIISVKTFVYSMFQLIKTKEFWLYIVFGVLTTLVDWAVSFGLYSLWSGLIDEHTVFVHIADVIAWAAAVLFSFFANRGIVFKSEKKGMKNVLGELAEYAGGRLLTLGLQEAIIFVFFDWLGINEYIVKIGASVLVVIINFFLCRFIFKKNGKETERGKI